MADENNVIKKYISLEKLARYDSKIKEYIDTEVKADLVTLTTDIGNAASLETSDKTIVGAINEIHLAVQNSLDQSTTALQNIEVGPGLTITEKANNSQIISFDENAEFRLDGGNAGNAGNSTPSTSSSETNESGGLTYNITAENYEVVENNSGGNTIII